MPATGSLNHDRPLMARPESIGSLPDTKVEVGAIMPNAICDAAITSAIFSRLAHLCKIILQGGFHFLWIEKGERAASRKRTEPPRVFRKAIG